MNRLSTIWNQKMYDPNIKNFYDQKWFLISIIGIIILIVLIIVGLIIYKIKQKSNNSQFDELKIN